MNNSWGNIYRGLLKISSFVLIAILFSHCSKELSNQNNSTAIPIPLIDTARVTQLVYLDTTAAAKLDTLLMQYFHYDLSGRVTTVITEALTHISGKRDTIQITTYHYNGTSNLANSVDDIFIFPLQKDSTFAHFFFTYNGTKLIADSATYFYDPGNQPPSSGYTTEKFSYSSSTIIRDYHSHSIYISTTDNYKTDTIIVTYYPDGELKSQTIKNHSTDSIFERQIFYNGKINPLKKTMPLNYPYSGIQSSFLQFVPDGQIQFLYSYSKIITNIYKLSTSTLLSSTVNNYSYDYNTIGNPSIMRVSLPYHSWNKYIFKY